MTRPEPTFTRKRAVLEYDRRMGALLCARRTSCGLSQADLGARLDVGQSMVSKLESGQRSVKLAEIPILAQALDMEPDELLAELWEVLQ